jgi:hypothetical protein
MHVTRRQAEFDETVATVRMFPSLEAALQSRMMALMQAIALRTTPWLLPLLGANPKLTLRRLALAEAFNNVQSNSSR